ncbi:MAG: hypothetical protein ACE361_25100 [Aureliella sp.]
MLPDSLAELDCDSLSDWLDSDNDSDPEDSEFEELAVDGWLKLLELPESESLESDWLLLFDDPLELLDDPLFEDDKELEFESTDEPESETDDSEPDDSELSLDD